MLLFHVFIYPQVLCICYLSCVFTSPGLSFCQMHIPLWFCRDMLLCISIPLSSPLFKRNSHISSVLFIVCSFYSLVSAAILCFRGYIVLYWRVRSAAVCSPTGSLSQQGCKTRFQQIPLKPHNIFEPAEILAEWGTGGGQSIKIFIGRLSPLHIFGAKYIKTNTISSAWPYAGPSTLILQSRIWPGSRRHGATAGLCCCCCCCAEEQTWS